MSNSVLFGLYLYLYFACLLAFNKRENGSTDQAQILCGTLQNFSEGLLMLRITKSCLQKSLIFVKF